MGEKLNVHLEEGWVLINTQALDMGRRNAKAWVT